MHFTDLFLPPGQDLKLTFGGHLIEGCLIDTTTVTSSWNEAF